MRHERLRSNRRLGSVSPAVGFLSGLTGRPTVRAVALLLTLSLSGCYTYGAWEPLAPGVAPLPDRILIRAPASDTFPRGWEVDLLHPWIDGDSVLVGTTLNIQGHEVRDSVGMPVTVRLPAKGLQIAGPRVLSQGRTVLLIATLVGTAGGVIVYATCDDTDESSITCPPVAAGAGGLMGIIAAFIAALAVQFR